MDEKERETGLKPKITFSQNLLDLQKTFLGVAAVQSSTGGANPNLPDALVAPLVTVLDPVNIHAAIYAQVDWSLVEPRLMRNYIINKQKVVRRPPTNSDDSSDVEYTSDGTGSRSESPMYTGRTPRSGDRGEPMDMSNFEEAEEHMKEREKELFVDEVVDLIRNIKKYNDPSLSSSQTWIDRLLVDRIAKQLVMIMSYLPQLVTIDEIVNALLFDHGPLVVERLLVEIPEHCVSFVNSLLKNFMQGSRGRYRNLVITRLLCLHPCFAHRVIDKFVKRRADCVFASRLAVEHLSEKEFLEFTEKMLTEKESILNKTMLKNQGRQVLLMIIWRLIQMAESVNDFHANAPAGTPPPEIGMAPWCTRLSFCLVELLNSSMEPWKERDVVTITKFVFRVSEKPMASESHSDDVEPMDFSTLQDSVDSTVPDSDPETTQACVPRPRLLPGVKVDPSPFGDAHETFVLSALLTVPFFTQYPLNKTGAVQPPDRAVENWLETSRKRALIGNKVTSTFGVHLIYVHSCILSSRIEELSKLANEGMKQYVDLPHSQNHANVLRNAFGSRCMTEIEVAKRSICLPVSTRFGREASDALALKSIHALQFCGVHEKFQINIGEWLEEQLENISLPISQILAEVVDTFAQRAVNDKPHNKKKGLSQKFLAATFSGDLFDSRTIPKRLLALLYVCSYRDAAMRRDSSMRNLNFEVSLFRKIPVRYLLSVMETYHKDYELVRSKIITRSAAIFPYMMPTPVSMTLIEEYQKTADMEILHEEKFGVQKENKTKALLENKDLQRVLEEVDRSSIRDQMNYLPVVLDVFLKSLNPTTPQGFEHPLIALFNRYEQLDPRFFFEHAANSWLSEDDIDVEDVIKIPALLFRCDRRILSSPPHFQCFVQALSFFNKAVRAENRLKMLHSEQSVRNASRGSRYDFLDDLRNEYEVDRKEKELLNGAYLDTQHSVSIHALIECCDAKRMKDDPSDFALAERRQKVSQIAFQYMHRTFIDHEGLIKIILYQKFPLRQVRDLVEGIPALFAGNSHILGMLALRDVERRFFAIVYAAEICRKYRVRESLDIARTVCDIVHSLHKFGQLPSNYKLWKHVAPALMLLATEFPSLADSINRLLTRVAASARNRLALRTGLLACDPAHEEYQLTNLISSFLDRNLLSERL